MEEKEYTLHVNGRSPRGRRKRNASVGSGGSVYVSIGSIGPMSGGGSTSSAEGNDTSIKGGASDGSGDNSLTQPPTLSAWILTPSPTSVKITEGAVVPRVSCVVERLVDGKNKRYTTTDQLTTEGVALWVKIDDGQWRPYTIGSAKSISALSAILATQTGYMIVTQGDDIDPMTADHLISFALRDIVDPDVTYSAVNVPVVKDGKDGDSVTIVSTEIAYAASQSITIRPETLTFYPATANGSLPSTVFSHLNTPGYHIWTRTTVTYSDGTQIVTYTHGRNGVAGVDGAQGPMVYPAGEWDTATEYSATAKACPVVCHNGQYYVLQVGQTSKGTNPAGDYATNGEKAAWQLMERMNYVFADILMANFAKLSEAVFYGDFMFSQHGIKYDADGEGVATTDYQNFTIGEDGRPTSDFVPNYLLNLRTGQLSVKGADLEDFKAMSGTLGAFVVTSVGLSQAIRSGEYATKSFALTPDYLQLDKTTGTTAANSRHTAVTIGRINATDIPVRVDAEGGTTAVAMHATASRASYCRAFEGEGHIVSNTAIQGYGLQTVALNGGRHILNYSTEKALINSSLNGGEVVPPRLSEIRNQLGIGMQSTFAVTMTIINSTTSLSNITLKGRTASIEAISSSDYPIMINSGDNSRPNGTAIAKGRIMQLMLVYDGSDYYAYYNY